jgi:hypothetical protein
MTTRVVERRTEGLELIADLGDKIRPLPAEAVPCLQRIDRPVVVRERCRLCGGRSSTDPASGGALDQELRSDLGRSAGQEMLTALEVELRMDGKYECMRALVSRVDQSAEARAEKLGRLRLVEELELADCHRHSLVA